MFASLRPLVNACETWNGDLNTRKRTAKAVVRNHSDRLACCTGDGVERDERDAEAAKTECDDYLGHGKRLVEREAVAVVRARARPVWQPSQGCSYPQDLVAVEVGRLMDCRSMIKKGITHMGCTHRQMTAPAHESPTRPPNPQTSVT